MLKQDQEKRNKLSETERGEMNPRIPEMNEETHNRYASDSDTGDAQPGNGSDTTGFADHCLHPQLKSHSGVTILGSPSLKSPSRISTHATE